MYGIDIKAAQEAAAAWEKKKKAAAEPAVEVGVGDAGAAQKRLDQIQNLRDLENPKEAQKYKEQQRDAESSGLHREIDMSRGLERGKQLFAEGSLGRVGEERSADVADIVSRRKEIMDKGFGAKAFEAAREARLQGMGQAEQMQQRRLRAAQAGSGVAGGLAGGQMLGLMKQQQQQRQSAERDLFLDEVNRRQGAIGAAEASIKGAEQDELARKQFNIGQKKDELMGQMTSMLTEAQLGVTERSSARTASAARDYADAVKKQGSGGKK